MKNYPDDRCFKAVVLDDDARLPEIFHLRVTAWQHSDRSFLVNQQLFPNGWSDPLDATASHVVVIDGHHIVAAGRVNFYTSLNAMPGRETFADFHLPTHESMALFSRTVVHPDYRRQGLAAKIDIVRHRLVKDQGMQIILGISGNAKRIKNFKGQGWQVLGQVNVKFHPEGITAPNEYALLYEAKDEISIWGRNLTDYQRMFSLSKTDLSKNILSVADGPASFNYEMNLRGKTVTSLDPIYELSRSQCHEKITQTAEKMRSKLKGRKSLFSMQSEEEVDRLIARRMRSMRLFLDDLELGKKEHRYQPGELPDLSPLSDQQFDLCLCANLLFLFEDFFSLEKHLQSVYEMVRIAREVRIFPLYSRQTGRESRYLKPTLERFQADFQVSVQEVEYEVYKGGNRMLVIKNS